MGHSQQGDAVLIRQGDVLLVPTSRLPRGHEPVSRFGDRLVLAEGEATGHAHVVRDTNAQLVKVEDEGLSSLYLVVQDEAAQLEHEEHSTLLIPPGIYEVRRQREWTGRDGWHSVSD